jgi:DNA-binding transcriptional MerR regulator
MNKSNSMIKIPERLYYKIGEVAQITKTEPYVLRYWETEFPVLKPTKNRSGQRLYRKKDVEIVLKIKELLYHEGYTIAGAQKKLSEEMATPKQKADEETSIKSRIKEIENELRNLLTILESDDI